MRALLQDVALAKHVDGVAVLDGGKAVRDEDGGPLLRYPEDGFLNALLGGRVYAGGRLVQDQDGRIVRDGAREGQKLPLALGERAAPLAEHLVHAVWQALDEGIGHGNLQRFPDLFLADRVRDADVLAHRAGKEEHVL